MTIDFDRGFERGFAQAAWSALDGAADAGPDALRSVAITLAGDAIAFFDAPDGPSAGLHAALEIAYDACPPMRAGGVLARFWE